MTRPSDLEIARAICCGEHCRSETSHCHAGDHFAEAYRVRKLLDRHALGTGGATEAASRTTPSRGEDMSQRPAPQTKRKRRARA